jgi:hypothetical protein
MENSVAESRPECVEAEGGERGGAAAAGPSGRGGARGGKGAGRLQLAQVGRRLAAAAPLSLWAHPC